MIHRYNQDNPYSRNSMLELETQFEVRMVEFVNVREPTVVDYLSPSVTMIMIDTSPNVTFSVPFPNVNRIHVFGESITFKDDMFPLLGNCVIGPSQHNEDNDPRVFLEPGQLKLRNTNKLVMHNAVMHADSLRDAHVHQIMLLSCQDSRPIPMIVPVIADGVTVLNVHPTLATPGGVHLTSIPNTLRYLQVPQNDLNSSTIENLHVHNQRLRYLHGPNAIQTRLVNYDRRLQNYDDTQPEDFAQENADRDLNVQRIRETLVQRFGDFAANEILQNMYGEHYGQAANGGGGRREYRKKKRNGKATKRGNKKINRKSNKSTKSRRKSISKSKRARK
jgi:hypothetical protein